MQKVHSEPLTGPKRRAILARKRTDASLKQNGGRGPPYFNSNGRHFFGTATFLSFTYCGKPFRYDG